MNFLAFIGIITIAIVSVIFDGFVLATLWRWFIVTTFNVIPLQIPQALGIALVIKYLTRPIKSEDKTQDKKEQLIKVLVITVLGPLFVLGYGWIIYQFI